MNKGLAFALTVASILVATGCSSTGSKRAERMDVLTKEGQAAMTPADVLARLKEGNDRFVAGDLTPQNYSEQVRLTAAGQYPMAIVLSCLDSRVPPETIFDLGIGDIFVGRVAGNFENVDMLGSMEFGTAVAGAKVIAVLGHTACGAVKGAADNVALGNLTATLANIQPAVNDAKAQNIPGPHNASNPAFVDAVTKENVRRTVRDITDRSEILRDRVASGDLIVAGGIYDLATGKVTWLD